MTTGRNGHIFGGLYQLHGRVDARHVRVLLFVLFATLAAVGCGGDNGGGGGGGY